MYRSLLPLFAIFGTLREASCLMRNIKPGSGFRPIANETLTPRDLFGRQSCDPGYGLCDTGGCCPLDGQCCGYGCSAGDEVCCGTSGTCDAGETCCTYNCAREGWGCCDTGYSAPLDADCCDDGGYCPSGTYCVDCEDGTGEGCCNNPYSVSSYYNGVSSEYIPEISSFSAPPFSTPYNSVPYQSSGGSSSYVGVDNYQYYYTVFTYWYIVYYSISTEDTRTVTSTTTTTSTRISAYAANSREAQSQFTSLESYIQDLASTPVTFSAPPAAYTSAHTSTGGAGLGRNSGLFARGDVVGLWIVMVAGLSGWLAIAL